MNFQEEIENLYHLELCYIWTHTMDEGSDNELILDPNYLFFEFNNHKILKIFDLDGKVGVTVEEKIDYSPEYKDEIDHTYKIGLEHIILDYAETDYFVEKIGAINIEIDADKMVCEAIQIELFTEHYVKQSIFIYSGIYGLSIGGLNKKNFWIERLYIPMYGEGVDEKWF